MKRKSLLLLSAAIFSGGVLFSQVQAPTKIMTTVAPQGRTCGVVANEARLQQADPQRAAERQMYEQMTQNFIVNNQNTAQAAITIPVVVHVLWNLPAENIPANQILSQIQVLNEDFTRTNADASNIPAAFLSVAGNFDVNFCLAQQDPLGNITTGIERRNTSVTSFIDNDDAKHYATGGLNAWDPSRYFNIWVCNLGGGLLGYAEFPTASLSNTYGVVILYNAFGSNYTSYGTFAAINTVYNRGRTVTHEIGHCFNLFHIWGDDGTGCGGSDQCGDTPNQTSENYGCPTYPHTDACSPANPGVMFMNYMDYTDDPCMYMFTNNQKSRAMAVLNSAPYNALQTSTACILPVNAPPVALFTTSVNSVCPATPINFIDQSSTNTTGWTWTFPGGSPSSSTVQNPTGITWAAAGTYTVTLVAANANGTSTYTLTVNVLGTVTPPLVQGFETTPFVPVNWSQYDAGNDGAVWLRYNAGRNSSYSAKFDNYAVNVAGNRDELRAPRLNLSAAGAVTMTFDVAHRRYSTANADNDSLEIAVSTNCGATWTSVYLKGGATLASVTGVQTTAFTPTNTQWRAETVNLNAYAGQSSVLICFRNRGHYGNNIYIDNVNITTTAAAPVAAITASTTTVCRGTAVSFTDASSGTPTSWSWTFPSGTPASATTQNVASVVWNTAGTYTVTHTATNATGTGTTTIVITVNPLPTITTTTTGATICNGSSTTITGGGGTTYAWMPGNLSGTTVTVSPTGTTTYTVTGTNANGCTNTATRTITVNPSPTITTTTSNGTICSGSSTTITGGGGTTYNWMPGNLTGTTVTVSPTTTTTYTVTGTGANGCTSTATRTITVNPSPTVTTTTTGATICNGSSTTITGGGATTYSWMPGSLTGTTVTVSPTTTTTYTVTGTSSGCTGTATRVITVNPLPTIGTTTTGATICNGGSTTITGTGGTSYAWMPGNLTGTTVTVSPTTTTTYTVTGTGANGCTATATRIITVNPSPTVTTTTTGATICSGSSTTITGVGATTYTWMPGNLTGTTVTVSPTTTTTYTVIGTSAGCTGTATRIITVNPTPTVTTTTTGATICNGSSTTITGIGATTYTWMPGNLTGTTVTVSPTTTTTYTVTGTSTGCTGTATRVITVNPSPTITTTTTGATICSGNSTTITGIGGTTYSWMPGNLTGTTITVSPGTTTTYTVTGTSAGCTGTATRTITVNPTPTVSASSSSSSICVGNTVTLTASGATTYNWMPGNVNGAVITRTPATTTTYTVTGTSAGCTGTATVTVTVGAPPTVTASAANPSICTGNSTTLTGNGASIYTWMPGSLSGTSVTVNPTATTTYTVSGSTGPGCVNTATVMVTVNSLPTISSTATNAAICDGNSTTITASGGITYAWMPGSLTGTTVTVAPTTSTTYTITGTDGNGCVSTTTNSITVNPLPNIAATTSGGTICDGNSTTLTASGGNSYDWMPGNLTGTSVTVAPTSGTTYTVTGTDANGCISTASVSITVNPNPTVTATISNSTVCSGTTVTLTSGGATTYDWMPGNIPGSPVTDVPTASTNYTVTGTDGNGCTSTATVSITVNPNPTVGASVSSGTICAGASVSLTGNGATTYDWQPINLSGSSVSDIPSASVTYTLTGTDANGCTATDMVSVTVNALPLVDANTSGNAICDGATVTLTGSGAATYVWQPINQTGVSVSDVPVASVTYTLTGTDANGCVNTDSVAVTVSPLPVISVSGDSLICPGSSTTLTASGASTYDWLPGGQTTTSITDSPAATTTYSVTGTDASGCSNSTTYLVTVDVPPAFPSIMINGNTLTSTVTGVSYQWFLNGNPIAGATSQSYVPTQNGSFSVEVYDAAGCGSGESSAIVDPLGIAIASDVDFISVVPNPNDGHFMLNFSVSKADNYTLEIHDMLGQIIYSETLNNFNGKFSKEINLSVYGRGMYSISLRNSVQETVIRTVTY